MRQGARVHAGRGTGALKGRWGVARAKTLPPSRWAGLKKTANGQVDGGWRRIFRRGCARDCARERFTREEPLAASTGIVHDCSRHECYHRPLRARELCGRRQPAPDSAAAVRMRLPHVARIVACGVVITIALRSDSAMPIFDHRSWVGASCTLGHPAHRLTMWRTDVVRWTCARHDSLVIMPTGGASAGAKVPIAKQAS